ncbi:MAG: VWA domain-containing protein [Bacillus sp. (in: firmicutes)]
MRKMRVCSKYIVFFVLLILMVPTITAAATIAPAVNFTVTPSQSEIVKPSNSDAQGSLDIRLTPEGKATNANRPPIDVAFVFDKSGSMVIPNDLKFKSAKNALSEAVKYFSMDPNKNDRFAFISFDSDVKINEPFPIYTTPSTYKVIEKLGKIDSAAQGLAADGGTNYTQSFQQAASMLTTGNNSNSAKYIFFMTDGQPTVSEVVENGKNVTYMIASYVNQSKLRGFRIVSNKTEEISLSEAKKKIDAHIQSEVNNLANKDIKLYSIGFGNNDDVDMNYLSRLSETTGVTAQQASTDTIAKIFQDISGKIATPTITATVKINISKFGGKVKLADGASATTDSAGNIIVKKDILFPINQDTPGPIDVSLPVTFSSTGTYNFDNIKLEYRDLDGVSREKTTSATITVKDDAPAGFINIMTLEKQVNELNNLVKTTGSNDRTNYFNVKYSLKPTNLVNNAVSGQLKNLVIEQPIPDSVSLIPSTNVTEQLRDGKRYAVISLKNNDINYSRGSFSPAEVTTSIPFKVDYAVTNLTMPSASLKFTDTRFSGSSTTSIPASSQAINMKVQLKEQNINKYEGDSAGVIEKRELATNIKLAQTDASANVDLANKAVKDMVYKTGSNNQIVEITYLDESKAYLYLVPNYELIGNTTKNKYNSGETANESIDMKLSNKVAGNDVLYYYQIKNGSQTSSWTAFTPTDVIPITKTGLNEIKVKATGGFSNNVEVSKNITITKKVQSITVNPNPINLTVNSADSVKSFTVTVEPSDATIKNFAISIENPTIATLIPGQNTISAKTTGTTTLVVKAQDGSNVEVRVPVTVIDPYIALDSIKFSEPVYKVEINEKLAIKDLLTFTPSNATNKELEQVISSMPDRVEVVKIGNEYYVKGNKIGYSTVTATAEKQKNGSQTSDSALFEVVKDNDGGGNGDGNEGDGRW